MPINPKQLNFGALAAERDIGLRQYFLESDAFTRFLNGQKFIALGNRGTGKSAIFRMVAERQKANGGIIVQLSPDDCSYEIMNQAMAAEAKGAWVKQGAYSAAWKHVIYLLAMKQATNQGARFKTGAAEKVYAHLRDKHAGVETNPVGALISYVKRLESFKVGSYEAAIKTEKLQQLYKLEELAALLPHFDEMCKAKPVWVLVDELDKGWDGSEDAKAFVAGLFQAAVSINQSTPNVHVLVSLRKELYDNIPALYDDAQKVRDYMELIEWDEPRLFELVARRVRHSVPELATSSAADAWNAIFTETLDYRGANSFNYIIDRTLYRPRELIQFCNDVAQAGVNKGEAALPADYRLISEAEHQYSAGRTKDIAAEYKFQFPGLSSVFETFRGLPYNFDREGLELHCLRIATGEIRVDAAAKWAIDQDPEVMIDTLWHVGFLKALAVGGIKARRRSGSSYIGSHQVEVLNLQNISRFHVHPMFRAHLAMKEPKKMKDAAPEQEVDE